MNNESHTNLVLIQKIPKLEGYHQRIPAGAYRFEDSMTMCKELGINYKGSYLPIINEQKDCEAGVLQAGDDTLYYFKTNRSNGEKVCDIERKSGELLSRYIESDILVIAHIATGGGEIILDNESGITRIGSTSGNYHFKITD